MASLWYSVPEVAPARRVHCLKTSIVSPTGTLPVFIARSWADCEVKRSKKFSGANARTEKSCSDSPWMPHTAAFASSMVMVVVAFPTWAVRA